MQAKGVAPEILRDKALSLQQLKRLATLDEEEEEEEEEEEKGLVWRSECPNWRSECPNSYSFFPLSPEPPFLY
jgi:hypothetical protein